MSFGLERVRNSKLVQWALAYLAGAWVLLQVLALLSETYAWHPGIVRALPVLLGVGLLGFLIVVWYHGERGQQRVSGVELLMLAGVLLIAGAAVAWVSRSAAPGLATPGGAETSPGAGSGAADPRSIAVLPFANLSDEEGNEYLASGLHDEILTQLANAQGLRVVSRTSVIGYAGTRKPIRQIAQELGAAIILEGTVQRSGEQVRVTAQLIDARVDQHLFAESYDRNLSDLFAIQHEIAQAIARSLKVRLGTGSPPRGEVDPEAYDLYLRGQYERSRSFDEVTNRRSMEYYRASIALDSSFAPAHASLAYGFLRSLQYPDVPVVATLERAESEARRALALDGTLESAHVVLASLLAYAHRDYPEAERTFRRAIELDPTGPDAHIAYGRFLRFTGRFDEAIRELERSIVLEFGDAQRFVYVGVAYAMAGRFEQAEAALDARHRAVGLAPAAWDLAYSVYIPQGRFAEARAVLDRLGGNEREAALAAYLAAAEGRRDEAHRILGSGGAAAMARPPAVATIYAKLGERDSAFAWLGRWAEQPSLDPRGSPFDPAYASLHDDPRWDAFLRRMRLR